MGGNDTVLCVCAWQAGTDLATIGAHAHKVKKTTHLCCATVSGGYAPATGGCAHTPNAKFPAACLPSSSAGWDPSVVDQFKWTQNSSIGCCPNDPLHSRLKSPIGRRLARSFQNLVSGKGPVTGPTVSGCTVKGNASIQVTFDRSANAEEIQIDPFDYNTTNWARKDAPVFMVCHLPPATPVSPGCDNRDGTNWVPAVPAPGPANSVLLSWTLPAGYVPPCHQTFSFERVAVMINSISFAHLHARSSGACVRVS